MISLLTLFTEPSKLCKELYVPDTETVDSASYIICSFSDSAHETELMSEIQKKFRIHPFFVSENQVAKKEQELRDFLKNKDGQCDGILIVYPIEDKLHVLVFGNLGILHFRNNDFEQKITGSFQKINRDVMKIETYDVLVIVRNEVINETHFDSLYQSQQYPLLFVDAVGEEVAIRREETKFNERIDLIASKKKGQTVCTERVMTSEDSKVNRGHTTVDDSEVIVGELVEDDISGFSRMKRKLIYSESLRGKLVGIVFFLVGFLLVLLIMFFLS